MDGDARRSPETFISLGVPRRAWMFGSLSNERDRPSLNLPRAQAVADVLEAFGWTGSRQNPRTDRDTDLAHTEPGTASDLDHVVAGRASRASSTTTRRATRSRHRANCC